MMDDSYWQGRVAVITGATHGIGLRLAERLADKGVRIATIYHNNDAQAIALRKTIEDRGSEYMIAKGDIAEKANIKELTDAADRRWGRIDFLINNIGVDISGPIAELSDEEWLLSQEIILNVPFRTAKLCLPIMRRQGFGRIIMMGASSRNYMTGQAGYAPFGINKAALTVLTKTLALEEIRYGITVNMVAPGSTAEAGINPEEKRMPIAEIHIGRRITRDEVTEAILYFLSENAAAVTGQVLGINGGCSV